MSTKKKLLQAAAGNAGGAGPAIEDVFSTYLYTGNGSTQTITNGIDLAGEGGLVWIKKRDAAYNNMLFDTERGPNKFLRSDITNAEEAGYTDLLDSFNSNGFTLDDDQSLGGVNYQLAGENKYASWTFRKAPRFFDVIRWDGDGTNAREIPHSLGAVPHVMITRPYNVSAGGWSFAHYDGTTWRYGELNTTGTMGSPSPYIWGDRTSFIAPTDSVITVAGPVTGLTDGMNRSGYSYITYLFAHDPLGPSGDGSDGLIACGSYTGNGSSTGPEIDLGWEPQWVMVKAASESGNWWMYDTMRRFEAKPLHDGGSQHLLANTSGAEPSLGQYQRAAISSATGFSINGNVVGLNTNSQTYIYIAIRRGPMRQPTSGTEVFSVVENNGDGETTSGFPVDAYLGSYTSTSGSRNFISRLTNNVMFTNSTGAEINSSATSFDNNTGIVNTSKWGTSNQVVHWMFRRAPGFFDVVAYDGGVASNAVPHNLGVTPEMYFIKCRSDGASNRWWAVYHKDLTDPAGYTLKLNDNIAQADLTNVFNGTTDASTFGVKNGASIVNESGQTYIAYLFASSPGVSKVGSYTGNGTSQTISCGFTSGARFILIKRIDSTGAWYVWDTERGIVAGNDPHLSPNNTAAEVTTDDTIDPDSSGFIVNQVAATNVNVDTATYIFYAIA